PRLRRRSIGEGFGIGRRVHPAGVGPSTRLVDHPSSQQRDESVDRAPGQPVTDEAVAEDTDGPERWAIAAANTQAALLTVGHDKDGALEAGEQLGVRGRGPTQREAGGV